MRGDFGVRSGLESALQNLERLWFAPESELDRYERQRRPVVQEAIIAQSDAYYDVAGARTSLRGRRDALINTPTGRTVVRLRTGMPSPTAIAGLRADLTIDAFANVEGRAAQRIVGVWPDAGIALAVDGTESVVRAGARDLLRVLITQFRQHTSAAA